MDSIDPGAYLSSLDKASNAPAPARQAPPAGAALDKAILTLAAASGPTGQPQESPAQQAARQTYEAAQKDQQYLDFGPWQTPVPIPPWLNNTLLGAGGRAVQLGQLARQSLGGSAPDEMDAATQAQAQSSTAGKVGSFITDAALTAPLGGAVTSGLARLGGVGARVAANTFGRAAVQGAVQGAATAPPGSRLEGGALGAVLSPVLPFAGSAAGKVVSGLTRTPAAQALLNRGVQLTPGQMNPEGAVVNRVEQAFTSLPLVGGMIANARNRAPQQFARSFLEDATAPGQALTTAKTDFNGLVADAQAGFDRAYDQTLRAGAPGGRFSVEPGIAQGGSPGYSVTQPLSDVFQQIADTPRLGLTASQRQAMGEQLQEKLAETFAVAKQSGGMTADDLQNLRSDLRAAARDVSPIDNASRAQRGFWNDAQQAVTQALESQLPTDTVQALRAIDSQYGKFAIARRAAVLAKDQPGGPTPAQLGQAVKEATAPNAYAAGGGFNRDAAKAARGVFQATVPHTGLTGIGTVMPVVHAAEGAGALALGAHNPLALAGLAAGLGAVGGAYTAPGLRALAGQTGWQRYLQGRLGAVPPAIQEALSRYGRTALTQAPLRTALQPQAQPLAPWMAPAQ